MLSAGAPTKKPKQVSPLGGMFMKTVRAKWYGVLYVGNAYLFLTVTWSRVNKGEIHRQPGYDGIPGESSAGANPSETKELPPPMPGFASI